MLDFLKKLFRKTEEPPSSIPITKTAVQARSVTAVQSISTASLPGVEVLNLSLRNILEKFTPDLRATVNQLPDEEVKVALPVSIILKQLPSGSVKMSLASLQRQSPPGVFKKASSEEKQMVEVPLGEIFKTLDPHRLKRRTDQKEIEIPDMAGVFSGGPGPMILSINHPSASGPAPAIAAPAPSAVPEPSIPSPSSSSAPRSPLKMPSFEEKAPAPQGSTDLRLEIPLSAVLPQWPQEFGHEFSGVPSSTKLRLPLKEVEAGLQKGNVAFTWAQILRSMDPSPVTAFSIPANTILPLPLKIVAPIFLAANTAKKSQSKVEVDTSLPDFFGSTSAPAPKKEPDPAPPPVIPESSESPFPTLKLKLATPEAAPSDPPAIPAEPPASPANIPPEAKAHPLSSLFNEPGKTSWTANELVRNTCKLPGVAGALIALEEGLVVAQQLPEGLSSETISAFMPQIFTRLNRYIHEMQLGDTHHIFIMTPQGPCQFFQLNKVFFAVIGRDKENIPSDVQLVANEIARQNS